MLVRPVATREIIKHRVISQPIRRAPSFADVIPVKPRTLAASPPASEPPKEPRELKVVTKSAYTPIEQPPVTELTSTHELKPKQSPKVRSKSWQALVLSLSATLLLVTTGIVTYQTWRTNTEARKVFGGGQLNTVTENDGTALDISSREGTDESPIDETKRAAYIVAPDMPRIIRIPDLNVEARVLRMGVSAKGNIEAPAGIWDTGWYDGSAKPGETGNAFIDGHISGPTQSAVFERLHTIGSGAKIVIERGDGSVLTYAVRSVTTEDIESIDMRKVLAGPSGSSESLTLMTCGGEYLGDYTYKSRVTVVADRVE